MSASRTCRCQISWKKCQRLALELHYVLEYRRLIPPKTHFLCLMVQKSSMLMIKPNSCKNIVVAWFALRWIRIEFELTWKNAMTMATMPTTWSFWIIKSWMAFMQPWFHHRSGRCFLNKIHCHRSAAQIYSCNLTFCNHPRHHIPIPHRVPVTLCGAFGSMTLAPTCLSASCRWNTSLRRNLRRSIAAQSAPCPR